MGSVPNYGRDREKMKSWKALESRVKNGENIMVKQGMGRYPKCLKDHTYEICPKQEPSNPEDTPKECRWCPNFIESPFHQERSKQEKLKRLQSVGVPTIVIDRNIMRSED